MSPVCSHPSTSLKQTANGMPEISGIYICNRQRDCLTHLLLQNWPHKPELSKSLRHVSPTFPSAASVPHVVRRQHLYIITSGVLMASKGATSGHNAPHPLTDCVLKKGERQVAHALLMPSCLGGVKLVFRTSPASECLSHIQM